MASAVIIDIKTGLTGSANSKDYPIAVITDEIHNAKITDIKTNTAVPKTVDYSLTNILDVTRTVTAESILPFFVKFTNIGIEGEYGPSNPAPIGIAVIGTNNYIL
jgi:hypothetical protein